MNLKIETTVTVTISGAVLRMSHDEARQLHVELGRLFTPYALEDYLTHQKQWATPHPYALGFGSGVAAQGASL